MPRLLPRLSLFAALPSAVLRRRTRRARMATLILLLLILPSILLLPFYTIYKPPSSLIRYFSQRWTDVLWRLWLPPHRKIVALTIDDAPSDHTREILAALKAGGAHATFFVIGGQVRGREEILREIVRQGHELGNHGMHDEMARELADEELERQMKEVERLIREAYEAEGRVWPGGSAGHGAEEGRTTGGTDTTTTTQIRDTRTREGGTVEEQVIEGKYYRPGSGFFSERMLSLVRKLGYRLVLGSIYPHDAQIGYAWLNARHILSMLSPGGIIICHDRRSWTPPMLRKVLPEMQRRGYKAVTVSQLLEEATG
ncbi:carbohydrate esterase family 4 protein [Neurospora crassa]|uniref:chitin deacetylase n=2 Tax=Neurospora crassa TaxID=5141 RepID=F5HAG8_NEUCR|nr:polysaccharide deacetylase [Neurospora crassa OR74A]EAA36147.3 polysaccharide deacetylase [Neurospora crassa OR74A]KHE89222.1 carbohydrate esterase family 4 protein [Neurospora crassa]|eukprot:XP_965383.3 polysaccharide deacetylase [Neurospora crassa OR74A]